MTAVRNPALLSSSRNRRGGRCGVLVAPFEAARGAAHTRIPEYLGQRSKAARQVARLGVGQHQDVAGRSREQGVLCGGLAASREAEEADTRIPGDESADDPVRAIGRAVAADEDLGDPDPAVVLGEDVGDPIGDLGRPVVDGDGHRERRQGVRRVEAEWPESGHERDEQGIAEIDPGQQSDREPEDDRHEHHGKGTC